MTADDRVAAALAAKTTKAACRRVADTRAAHARAS